MSSLKNQLIVWIIGLLTAVGVVASVISFVFAQMQANTFLDQQLQEIARSVDEGSQFPEMRRNYIRESRAEQTREFVIQVWEPNKATVCSRPDFDMPISIKAGFRDRRWHGIKWRVYTMVHKHRTVQVSQEEVVRTEIATQSAAWVLLPFLFLIPLSWVIVAFLIGRLLRPLQMVISAAIKRDINSNSPLPSNNIPTEVTPLINAINDLIVRLSKALKLQRKFISDAAHGLRTPLAALQLQIENLPQNKSEEDMVARINDMRRGAQRATRMVRQLLQISRYESQDKPITRIEFELVELVKECIAEIIPVADQHGVDLGMTYAEPVKVKSNRGDLQICIGNLLENAVRYTPEGGAVDISVKRWESKAILEICDTGPGIPESEITKVFDRFYRATRQDIEGTGIGLAIVKMITDREAIKLEFLNREDRSGLRVRLEINPSI